MLTAIVSAFLGGLILNVMPCVFPILSLKAIAMVRHGDRPGDARAEGIAFFAGVMLSMLAVAGVLLGVRAAGVSVGWGFQLQSPVVIGILALVMFAVALNLSGLFEMGTSLQNIGQELSSRSGWIGSALTGALAVVVATPCTAPFMAGAVAFSLVQPPFYSLVVFAFLGIGFAAPFTLLSFVPQWAQLLPRPGPWMNTARRLFAFPMYGATAWLIWVMSQQAGQAGLAALLMALLALGFSAWMYGMAQNRLASGGSTRPLYALAGIALVIMAGVMVESGLQPMMASAKSVPSAPTLAAASPIKWSPELVASLRTQHKPILINFTAAWCVTCQVNDRVALSTGKVRQALQSTGAAYLVADSTKFDPAIQSALAHYGRGGLPVYVVYPADGRAPVLLPQILTPGIVVDALQAAEKKPA